MSSSSMNPFDKQLKHITKSHGNMPSVNPQQKPTPKPPDKTLAKPGQGGGGGKRAKPVVYERESEEEKAEREHANTPPPEKPVDRTVVKITNIAWKTDPIVIGGAAWATMDVSIPPEHEGITGITCTVEVQAKGGHWHPGTKSFRCDAKDGKAECEVELQTPSKGADGTAADKAKYRVIAKHSYSEHAKGPEKESGVGEEEDPYDGIIYYSPNTQKYLYIKSQEEFKSVHEEFENLR